MSSLETIEALLRELKEQNINDHTTIICHQKETNGRVNKLENFKNKVVGALVIMNVLLLPLILSFANNVIKKLTQ